MVLNSDSIWCSPGVIKTYWCSGSIADKLNQGGGEGAASIFVRRLPKWFRVELLHQQSEGTRALRQLRNLNLKPTNQRNTLDVDKLYTNKVKRKRYFRKVIYRGGNKMIPPLAFKLHEDGAFCLFCSLLYSRYQKQYLARNTRSVDKWWMYE